MITINHTWIFGNYGKGEKSSAIIFICDSIDKESSVFVLNSIIKNQHSIGQDFVFDELIFDGQERKLVVTISTQGVLKNFFIKKVIKKKD